MRRAWRALRHASDWLGREVDRLGILMQRVTILGAALAIVCHFLPPHLRVVCDHVLRACR